MIRVYQKTCLELYMEKIHVVVPFYVFYSTENNNNGNKTFHRKPSVYIVEMGFIKYVLF